MLLLIKFKKKMLNLVVIVGIFFGGNFFLKCLYCCLKFLV